MAATPTNPINLRSIIVTSSPTGQSFLVTAIDLPANHRPTGFHEPSGIPGQWGYLQSPKVGYRVTYEFPYEIPTEMPAEGTAIDTYLLIPCWLGTSWERSKYIEVMVVAKNPNTGDKFEIWHDSSNSYNLISDQPQYGNQINLRGLIMQSAYNQGQFFYLALADFKDEVNPGNALINAVASQVTLTGFNNIHYPPNTPSPFTLLQYPGTSCLIPDSVDPQVSFMMKPYHYFDSAAASNFNLLPPVVFEIDGINKTTKQPDKVTGSATGRPSVEEDENPHKIHLI